MKTKTTTIPTTKKIILSTVYGTLIAGISSALAQGTTTIPDTGSGGEAGMNYVILTLSAVLALGGAMLLSRKEKKSLDNQ